MNIRQIEDRKFKKIKQYISYQYCYYLDYDFDILKYISARKKNGSHNDTTYNLAYIMLDTETSKSHPVEYDKKGQPVTQDNHIVCWSLSVRAFNINMCTLRGSTPSECMHCLKLLRKALTGDRVYIFVHNLSYDWQFLRRFFFRDFDLPVSQLNVKNHYPILIQFNNGLILRDSLILAGVSLDKWGSNLDIEHKKVKQCWNYDQIRDQSTELSDDELLYIEHDTLAGVECLNKLADSMNDTVISLPFTNTGIVRRHIRSIGKKNYAKTKFNKQLTTFNEQVILEKVYHGGFTHANRHILGWVREHVKCKDFKSSYPYCMLTCKVPSEKFYHFKGVMDPEKIIKDTNRSYIFKLIMVNPRLKDYDFPMPILQYYKCEAVINPVIDNGRILCADYVEIYLTEIDLRMIHELYDYDEAYCVDIMTAVNDYIPRWYRDEVFNIFKEKCELEYQIKVLKSGDISLYNLCKARLNSLYGMSVTKPIKPDIIEAYEDTDSLKSGDNYYSDEDLKEKFEKYNKNINNILPYVWGVYVTATAMYNLFELAKCIDDINSHWIYSDTDSIYSDNWNEAKLEQFNQSVKDELVRCGYGAVRVCDREYWLGIAEDDGNYDEFVTQGAKRYCTVKHGKLSITVAGVPKRAGACCLRSIDDFVEGFVFYGQGTGKNTHYYMYSDIYIDERGNECADSVDLLPADYTLSCVERIPLAEVDLEDVAITMYEEI